MIDMDRANKEGRKRIMMNHRSAFGEWSAAGVRYIEAMRTNVLGLLLRGVVATERGMRAARANVNRQGLASIGCTSIARVGVLAAAVLLAASPVNVRAATFTAGNVAVLQIGDGSTALSSSSFGYSVLEYLPSTANQASPVQTISIPSSSGSYVTGSGSASSEGNLALSSDKKLITFAGYASASGVTEIKKTTGTTANRCAGVVKYDGTFSRAGTGSTAACSGDNVRGAVSDGVNFWISGHGSSASANAGVWYSAAGGTPSQIQGGNTRAVNIFNSTLYSSSGSAAAPSPGVGVSAFSGLPTSAASGTLIINGGSGSPSPHAFAINAAGNLAYVADDRSISSGGGIQRWDKSGSTWSLTYTLATGSGSTVGAFGLAVDFSGANPVIYATTSEASGTANRLIRITDTGSGSSATVLATASSTKYWFRGVALAPIAAYTVTYNGNGSTGGNVPVDSTAYAAGATVTAAANSGSLVKSGYTFAGWNTAADGGGTTYTAGSGAFTINANTTLYAKWTVAAKARGTVYGLR